MHEEMHFDLEMEPERMREHGLDPHIVVEQFTAWAAP